MYEGTEETSQKDQEGEDRFERIMLWVFIVLILGCISGGWTSSQVPEPDQYMTMHWGIFGGYY